MSVTGCCHLFLWDHAGRIGWVKWLVSDRRMLSRKKEPAPRSLFVNTEKKLNHEKHEGHEEKLKKEQFLTAEPPSCSSWPSW
ncbi:hypothetical protein [Desulfoluna limicola]|uniref:hypothetical protein n=1 Tax=Desulfoluna limicola TaxID=2810562 RepID=UPI001F348200|nr:hypothetical protein [Desulfoluna limicola]